MKLRSIGMVSAMLVLGAWACSGCLAIARARAGPGGALRGRLRDRLRDRLRRGPGENPEQARGRDAETIRIAGLHVSVWEPSAAPNERKERLPLVIFSHGFHGSSTQSTFLMRAIAEHGYLVLAPNHKDSLRGGAGAAASRRPEAPFGKPEGWTAATYNDRADDILALLKALKADEKWSARIEWSKVGLAGHSLGGYTVLGLGGAWPAWKSTDVKAVLALSPYCAPFVRKNTLGGLRVPVMYQGGTRDVGITPSVRDKTGAFDLTPAPAYFVELQHAGHFAWTDLNPAFQKPIIYYSLAFLDRHLKGDATADPTRKRPEIAELRSK